MLLKAVLAIFDHFIVLDYLNP